MNNNRTKHRKFHIAIAVWVALLTGLAFGDEYIAWQHFQTAANSFSEGGDINTIVTLCEQAKKETRDAVLFSRISFLQSEALLNAQKYDGALKALEQIGNRDGKLPDSIREETELRRGIIFLKSGKENLAVKVFQSLHDRSAIPFIKLEASLALAWQSANRENWTQCRSLIDEIVSENPAAASDSRLSSLQARLSIAENEPQHAIDLLKNERDPLSLSLLANAYEMVENRILAVSIYKKINDQFPGSPAAAKAMLQAADVFMRGQDWLAAQSELKRFRQYFPDSRFRDAVTFRLGWVYLNLNQTDDALSEFSRESESGNSACFQYMQAECFRMMGKIDPAKYQDAIRRFHTIASLNANSPIAPLAKIKAAMTELEKGDSLSAVISMRQFLSMYPKNEIVPAVNFMLAMNEEASNANKYFDRIIQSRGTGSIPEAAFFALQNEDFQRQQYQQVINRNSYLKSDAGDAELSFWERANYLLMAESAYFLKHYDLAKENYNRVLSEQPDDLSEKAQLGLTWIAFYEQGVDAAIDEFRELKNTLSNPNKSAARYGYATALFHQEKYAAALQEYPVQPDDQRLPENAALISRSAFHVAECYYRLQQYAEAIDTWERMAIDFPQSPLAPDALFQAADLYFRANYFEDADSMLTKIIRKYPGSPVAAESHLRLAQSAYNAENYDLAINRYQQFLDKYPDHEKNTVALEGIQYSYYQLGQTDQAAETFRKVAEQSANAELAVDARYRMATNYLAEGSYEAAATEFKEILTAFPSSSYAPDAQFSLAKAFMAQEKYPDAAREFSQFIQYFPASNQLPEANFLLGVCYFNMESYLSAIDCFDAVIAGFPESGFAAHALQNAGWTAGRLNDHVQALEYFRQYLTAYPSAEDAPKIRLQMANEHMQLNQHPDAIELYTTLIRTPDGAIASEAIYHLGMLYLQQNQVDEAESIFSQSIGVGESADYYRLSSLAQLAAIYENIGKDSKAVSAYQLLVNSTSEERWVVAAEERIQALTDLKAAK